MKKQSNFFLNIRWLLVLYDLIILALVDLLLLAIYRGGDGVDWEMWLAHTGLAAACIILARLVTVVYNQIWRYGGVQCYIRLMFADFCAFLLYCGLNRLLPIQRIPFDRIVAICCLNLLASLMIRMLYRYAYKCGKADTWIGRLMNWGVRVVTFGKVHLEEEGGREKVSIAIVGAGRVGVSLAEELKGNPGASYVPKCFIDISELKIGRRIHEIPVLSEAEATFERLNKLGVEEVVFAVPQMDIDQKKALYEHYKEGGFRLKVYDFPIINTANGKRNLREFDVEELLFRKPLAVTNEETSSYYRGKTVLITGGGGSIGSELCRQIAPMEPKRLIILDICENGAYDIQQELKIAYGDKLDVRVVIVSVCNRVGLERAFRKYRPQIVLNAAAHKHVPLMENDCIEAVENNVFGTLNTVELSEKYNVERVIMVSTDKAVNPTNVMGATKRMCEMIVQSHSQSGSSTTFSATRFGNVLGSAGSVIPLFRRQIAAGGPLTITDKRIIRFFMTIPEASQLVLQSGAIAKNGELFVLDMGKPVKILELAENMIRLAGLEPGKDIEIQEIGLRPGEKLYEELLVRTEELDRTGNELIFIERDKPLPMEEINEKLAILREAVESGEDDAVRNALMRVVPTFRRNDVVNAQAEASREMAMAR